MPSEFDLIRRHFQRPAPDGRVVLGVGDDAALLAERGDRCLTVSSDTLLAGVHFLPEADPERLGRKALAVNLSDLAAMGARPLAFSLALSLPAPDEDWLTRFAAGLHAMAAEYDVPLIGGDTVRGPLALSLHILGERPCGGAGRRGDAQPGDDLYLSGTVGDAALGLELLRGRWQAPAPLRRHCLDRLETPTPRVALGQAVLPWVHALIDCSDGLAQDLGHVLVASGTGATVDLTALPLSAAGRRWRAEGGDWETLLAGGDDYELLLTAPPGRRAVLAELADACGVPLTRIGRLRAEPGLDWLDADGRPLALAAAGFDHFRGAA